MILVILMLSQTSLTNSQEHLTVRIDRKENSWWGSMRISLTALGPDALEFPISAMGLTGGS